MLTFTIEGVRIRTSAAFDAAAHLTLWWLAAVGVDSFHCYTTYGHHLNLIRCCDDFIIPRRGHFAGVQTAILFVRSDYAVAW